ncbi:Uncharacterized protein K02A2.6 [Toxocara canis]|uniref:Uncharacterized protein K02A2.6 n=2 Tax=Toxocara canis TaxID=6265 RepID=A0A0B2VFG2_TOXCA|nr:Uncharacterized protein K02A2.6 [Toxocara canis]
MFHHNKAGSKFSSAFSLLLTSLSLCVHLPIRSSHHWSYKECDYSSWGFVCVYVVGVRGCCCINATLDTFSTPGIVVSPLRICSSSTQVHMSTSYNSGDQQQRTQRWTRQLFKSCCKPCLRSKMSEPLDANNKLLDLISKLQTRTSENVATQQSVPSTSASRIPELPSLELFHPDEQEPWRFEEWIQRFEYLFEGAAPSADDKARVETLMTKLGLSAFSEYRRSCLPKDVTDFTYTETVGRQHDLLNKKRSLFADRYTCMRISKQDGENIRHYANRLKAALRNFKFSEITEEQFASLTALAGIKDPNDEFLRARMLQKLDADGTNVKFDDIINDCVHFIAVKADSQLITGNNVQLNTIRHSQQRRLQRPKKRQQKSPAPPSLCFRCGELHWNKDCPHISHKCRKCARTGHLESKCRKPKRHDVHSVQIGTVHELSHLIRKTFSVNGVPVEFCLDTGAEANIVNETT